MYKLLLTFQVSYLDCTNECRSDNRFLFAVSGPSALCCFAVVRLICEAGTCLLLSNLLLLLSGDVELNPGPTKPTPDPILNAIQKLEAGQATLRAEIEKLKLTQESQSNQLSALNSRLLALESNLSNRNTNAETATDDQITQELATLKTESIELNNRLRRNNLLFLGLDDADKESWKESEEKVVAFCQTKLNFQLNTCNIERAHRIGTPSANKKRPIIVKFTNFKTKDSILLCGPKLKNTTYAIREDFASATRLARSKLLKFIKPQKCAFKLRLDKLLVGNKCYFYNPATDSISECAKSSLSSAGNAESPLDTNKSTK